MSSVISYIYRLNNVRIFLNPKPNKKTTRFQVVSFLKIVFLFLKLDQLYAGFFKEFHGEFVRVGVLVDNALDSAVDDDAGADCAGLMGDVHCCAVN